MVKRKQIGLLKHLFFIGHKGTQVDHGEYPDETGNFLGHNNNSSNVHGILQRSG
jgi:hypothetical protein